MKAKIPASKGVQRITLVELTGLRSNEFEGDLKKLIKHLDVID
jgi:hypothetical protein